ncbi:MAG: carbohydrate kinase, partial [Bacteroidaceae bacterium]|nr:carbohydrate kinase [Bacteroidaceae bacterium]
YTDGAKDIRIHTPEFHLTFPVEQIPTVSTVGAGDSFNAGFVYGLIREQIGKEKLSKLQSEDWARLVEYGQRFSREVCQSMENYISKKKQDA